MHGDITIKINISKLKPDNKKHVVNSIKGFVKAIAKREGLEVEFEAKENREHGRCEVDKDNNRYI